MIAEKLLAYEPFQPTAHIAYNADGLIVPTASMPQSLLNVVRELFLRRKEDEPRGDEAAASASDTRAIAELIQSISDHVARKSVGVKR